MKIKQSMKHLSKRQNVTGVSVFLRFLLYYQKIALEILYKTVLDIFEK
jgi:hypothetical protein